MRVFIKYAQVESFNSPGLFFYQRLLCVDCHIDEPFLTILFREIVPIRSYVAYLIQIEYMREAHRFQYRLCFVFRLLPLIRHPTTINFYISQVVDTSPFGNLESGLDFRVWGTSLAHFDHFIMHFSRNTNHTTTPYYSTVR
ncbi:MAG: hypothetical protein BWZ09_01322 [Alphaproteobacteria bacterium ADurb.BinA305]|nr:MAG: hypothetical protein BWZ09_01322 [Alphaproteobacteria bacterium ADurb.BinA305]